MPIYEIEPEVQDGRRALAKTQELWVGVPERPHVPNPLDCGWYGTEVSLLRGSFAYVKEGEGLDDFVGEFVRCTNSQDTRYKVTVYVLGQTPLLQQSIALARRPFMVIEHLSAESVPIYADLIR